MEPVRDLLVPAPPHAPMMVGLTTLLHTALRFVLPFPLRGYHSMKMLALPMDLSGRANLIESCNTECCL